MSGPALVCSRENHEYNLSLEQSQSGGVCAPPPPEPNKSEAAGARERSKQAAQADPEGQSKAVGYLVDKASKPLRLPAADSGAQRTADRAASSYRESGTTRSGDRYSEAAALRGKDASGADVEVVSFASQRGAQNEVSVTGYRLKEEFGGGHSVTSELATAKTGIGKRNGDGSEGFNVALQANLAQSEWTLRKGANEVTLGLSAGVGAEFAIGERDSDGDGLKEACVRVGVGPIAYGQCVEEDPHVSGGSEGASSVSEPQGAGGAPPR